jgi:alpha-tubulin suppressor-like RCC1 family protein
MDQLGNGSTNYSTTPGPVSNLSGGVQSVSCGGNNACILSGAGVECWGDNMYGELGSNAGGMMSATPVVVGPWAQ